MQAAALVLALLLLPQAAQASCEEGAFGDVRIDQAGDAILPGARDVVVVRAGNVEIPCARDVRVISARDVAIDDARDISVVSAHDVEIGAARDVRVVSAHLAWVGEARNVQVISGNLVSEPPEASGSSELEDGEEDEEISDSGGRDGTLRASVDTVFFPQQVAHRAGLRHIAQNDSYIGVDLHYAPNREWRGRIGAGIDVLGGGGWDVKLGLFLGGAGEWAPDTTLAHQPMAGTEVGLGIEGKRIFGRYRWMAGLGTGPLDGLLTENELTVGYRVLSQIQVYGSYAIVNPGRDGLGSGVGLGIAASF